MDVFDLNHCVTYVMAVLLIGVFVLAFYNRVFIYRAQQAASQQLSQNSRLALVLKAGRLRIWKYVPLSRHYFYLSEEGSMEQEYNPIELAQLFNRDDFENLRQAVFDICEGVTKTSTVKLQSNAKDGDYNRHYEVTLSIGDVDAQGHVESVLGIQHDVTEEYRKQQHVKQLLMRYHTVFNSSLIDMIYYDSNGVLQDINEKACQAFGVRDREYVIHGNFLLENNPMFCKLKLDENLGNTRTTSLIDFSQYKDERYHLDKFGLVGKMYYESTINPIRDAEGKLQGVYMAGRNVTEMVESFHHQQEGAERLRKVNKDIQAYITNVNYALRVSNVRMVNYYPRTYTLEVSDNINETQMRLSQLRCIRLATPRFRRTVSSMLNRMDHLSPYNISESIETEFRDEKGRQVWLLFSMVPMKGQNGKVERYFGMCRDMTDMVETERRLAVETKKAQETELLKQSFLANMSYEIRTPLNNVVGFAELFNAEHDESDEPSFVEQIKLGTHTMLQLVNDVLYLSRLDANMVEYKKEDVDFAQSFESHCQLGWSGVSNDVKTVVDNPYQSLVVGIDEEHVGKVIEKLCSLAGMFTKQGSVTARCEYRRGELTISVEDSGVGIDAETLPHVFDRFVRNAHQELCGTGLDLPIVQLIVRQMGGTIEMESTENRGTTVWVSIPCEAKVIEKRIKNESDDSKSNPSEPPLLLL